MHDTRTADVSFSTSAGTRVVLNNVRRAFPTGVVALDGISLHVPGGQFTAILGPSGCGKSTLLRLVAGLDAPQSGTVELQHPEFAGVSPNAHHSPRADIA